MDSSLPPDVSVRETSRGVRVALRAPARLRRACITPCAMMSATVALLWVLGRIPEESRVRGEVFLAWAVTAALAAVVASYRMLIEVDGKTVRLTHRPCPIRFDLTIPLRDITGVRVDIKKRPEARDPQDRFAFRVELSRKNTQRALRVCETSDPRRADFVRKFLRDAIEPEKGR